MLLKFWEFLGRHPALPWIGILVCLLLTGYLEGAP